MNYNFLSIFLLLLALSAQVESNDSKLRKETNAKEGLQFITKEEKTKKASFNIPKKKTKNFSVGNHVNILLQNNKNSKKGDKYIKKLLKKTKKKNKKKKYKLLKKIKKFDVISMKMPFEEFKKIIRADLLRIELDRKVYALFSNKSNEKVERKLLEDIPYGIDLVLEDRTFWNNLISENPPPGSIKVCVADTGYDLGHVDLPFSYVTGQDNSENGVWDTDGHSHGTHVAGTISAIGENNEGVVGIIPNSISNRFELVIGKALNDNGEGTYSSVLEAVENCVKQGASIVNLSLGGSTFSDILNEGFERMAREENVLFIAAAGNSGDSTYLYPASFTNTISVAASSMNGNDLASFSTFNDQVELTGPGVFVRSTVPNNGYSYYDGTSMATPHVSGVAALLWLYFPNCKNYQIRHVLWESAKDINNPGCDIYSGHGFIRAKKAYELLENGFCENNDFGYWEPPTPCAPRCQNDSDCNDGNPFSTDSCTAQNFCLYHCSGYKLEVVIVTDGHPEDTSWEVLDLKTNKILLSVEKLDDWWTTYTTYDCFGPGSYEFIVHDSRDDEFTGRFTVTYAGIEIVNESDGFFGPSFRHQFQLCQNDIECDDGNDLTTDKCKSNNYCEYECTIPKLIIVFRTDSDPQDTKWELEDTITGNVVASSRFEDNMYWEKITTYLCIGAGNYQFTVFDSRDGVFDGSYTVTYLGTELVSGGKFRGTFTSSSFILCDDATLCEDDNSLTINKCVDGLCKFDCTLPNTIVQIRLDSNPKENRWEISNESGEVIYSSGFYGDNMFYELITTYHCLGSGTYKFTIFDVMDGVFDGYYSISYLGIKLVDGDGFLGVSKEYTFIIS